MAYRQTDRVKQQLAARHGAIISAARVIAAESGLSGVQILAVAERAGIAAGTVYRYFPAKTDLVAALLKSESEREIAAIRIAADAAPGPLSALAAAIVTFSARVLRKPKLAWAVIAEPLDAQADIAQVIYRRALISEFEARIRAASAGGHLPEPDAYLAALALFGALIEGLVGPLAPKVSDDSVKLRASVQMLTLMALRSLGVLDARARGIVVQTPLPAERNT